ncbi:hypothetical protein EUX98_g4116 [Antrodiella citrinella]|uniref:Peptidase S26 domain-containing protein n=1 Tax=Antrodiella citrinella TaxID=2447956 RepID=A0A4S4MUU7_9APHY|nr:hypothetical protein EUX98_g4116 [Antrodiella citrinella]
MQNLWRTASRKLQPWSTKEGMKFLAKRGAILTCHFVNAGCALHLFSQHVGWIHQMAGPSMLPTLANSGEWIIQSQVSDPHKLSRGDLVIYASPLHPKRIVCKRLLGLPGDVVCVDPTGDMAPSTEHVIVPKGHMWMIGDNSEFARDSRTYGPVSMALVKGKLVARCWPPSAFTIFHSNFEYID